MTAHCALQLTSYEAIDGVHIRLEQTMHGWDLWIMHRHLGGRFGDCEAEVYTQLTFGEVLDVIDATTMTVPTL